MPQSEQWEYEPVRPERDATKKEAVDPKRTLTELGADGWELLETITYEGAGRSISCSSGRSRRHDG